MRAALEKLDGVLEVKCDPDAHEARVKHVPTKVTVEALLKAIKDAGYGDGKLVKTEPAT